MPSAAPPRHLSRSSKAVWTRLVSDYALDGEAAALEVLRLGLEAVDRGDEARKAIKRDGEYLTNRHGEVRPHPALAVERDSAIRAARMFRELSLDPGDTGDVRIPRPNGARS